MDSQKTPLVRLLRAVVLVSIVIDAHAIKANERKTESAKPEIHKNDVEARIARLETSLLNLRVEFLERDRKISEIERETEKNYEQELTVRRYSKTDSGSEREGTNLNFASWTGILLAAVSTIVTVLGVAVALLSFFGYRATITKAKEVAAKSAESAAIKEIKEQIESGRFDGLIVSAVDKVALSSMSSELETDDAGNASEPHVER